jgi:FtsP/CotA-like multicopper oxidase with cupredoxin domain
LPVVQPNDNTSPAGRLEDGTLRVSFEVSRADWRLELETDDGPGLRVAAVSEEGGPPMIPAPLIRVEAGTHLRVTITNRLVDVPIAVFGLHSRPAGEVAPLELAGGESRTVSFEAGEPGTYLYWIREGPEPEPETIADFVEREQLAGAFVIDPVGRSRR